jgi:shikimate kinase
MNVYLTGFMGCGKTTLGKKLARKMNYTFFDLDSLIIKKLGKSIKEIFDQEGEEYFRKMEKEVLTETLNLKNAVIATGGGTPCFFDNILMINSNAISVYLEMDSKSLFHRLKDTSERPLLMNMDENELIDFISKKLKEREKFYLQSKLIFPALNANADELKGLIQEHLYKTAQN